ncbi:acyltransferase family protein [Nocardioides ganghwensis]|jgi:peptidoglycan/LPS O-acetylase OafA/YrhL|uniref:Acyltransferase n=1 Tax=Nocardioides ganghwensis TaxID=252230 RepID=A0A4Q2SA72_9ACTN|nr:acyltransferase [Nocardioides ganghwensis]MBD3947859.1 acyltransferase [Nocardioides ganghwensis]RYB97739.1 acyltransferase [Nocardioides ganghwensis]
MTLRNALLERPNSLNLLRLVLAGSVIVGHAWPVGREGAAPGWVESVVSLAVPGFFCLSGFLIAHSRMRLPLGRFMWNRCLRILPAYWVVLAAVALVAAPLSTLGGGVWSASEAVRYMASNAALRQFTWTIPGTVDGWAWNGSLWTLWFEFIAYIGAGVLLSIALVRRHPATVSAVLYVLGAVSVWWMFGPGGISTDLFRDLAWLGTYFLAGMTFYFLSGRVPLDARWAIVSVACLALFLSLEWAHFAGGLPLAYSLLWAGAVIPARWAQRNDVSYGVYIYAFPVQVLLEWFVPGLGVALHIVLAFAITVPLAWTSWLLVERPAMRLKHLDLRRDHPRVPPRREPTLAP